MVIVPVFAVILHAIVEDGNDNLTTASDVIVLTGMKPVDRPSRTSIFIDAAPEITSMNNSVTEGKCGNSTENRPVAVVCFDFTPVESVKYPAVVRSATILSYFGGLTSKG